jgi:hypothetical protein
MVVTETYLTRHNLATRWGTSVRTIDRIRQEGSLPWVDISAGRGARPLVRFRLSDVESYESAMTQKALDRK